ncbi:MAG: hypothetical protein ACRBBN_14540 [Methyloligellaceae bacterium]
MSSLKIIASIVRNRFWFCAGFALLFTVTYYFILLGSLVVRFGHVPNYLTPYNWFGNVWVIIQSTPSITDVLSIIQEEWLLEIGYMNFDYGNGISVWSLNLLPFKMLIVFLVGLLIAINISLLQYQYNSCSRGAFRSSVFVTGAGGFLVAVTNATMTWVVCCATPSWVVGLAMLGLGVSTSLWLEPLGVWLAFSGMFLLGLTTLFLAHKLIPLTNNIKQKDTLYAE